MPHLQGSPFRDALERHLLLFLLLARHPSRRAIYQPRLLAARLFRPRSRDEKAKAP